MAHFSGYGAYVVYLTIRTHFNSSSFDFFKYQKVKTSREAYNKRNDKSFFEKIAKMYTDKELIDYFIANILEDRTYIIDMIDEDSRENWLKYMSRKQSLTYLYKNDLDNIFENGCKEPFQTRSDKYPDIITLYLNKSIAPESMIILNDYISFFPKFDKYFGDNDPIWSRISLKLKKYRPFLKYDKDKYKNILRIKIEEKNDDQICI